MSTFRVWAPRPQSIELFLDGNAHPMQSGENGWWHTEIADVPPGTDYGYILDGGKPLPDPRSAWQPQGVHELSRTLDHSSFTWHDRGWQSPPLASAIIYELHVGTFTPAGDFNGVIDKLEYLRSLGITHIELLPVNEFAGSVGWGYDGVSIFAPHHAYGGPDGLKRLVNACHQAGLGVILDVVYNHFGPEGNYLEQFGPYLTEKYSTAWGKAVNFDGPGSDEVRHYVVDNAVMWLRDYHMDGLRLDGVHAIVDTCAIHIVEQLVREVRRLEAALGRHLFLIGESDLNDPRLVRERSAGGYGLDAQWSDDFHHALHVMLTGERSGYYTDFRGLSDVAKALQEAFVYTGMYSTFRNRHHGRVPDGLPGYRFLGYVQNHDQIGNRALGERIGQLVGPRKAAIGAALVMAAPFVPMIFAGEEWGASTPFQFFCDFSDPDLQKAVTEGRRREFAAFNWNPQDVPDPQERATFERSRLNWQELTHSPHEWLLGWYRDLIALRRTWPELLDGNMERVEVQTSEVENWIVMGRGRIVLACNLASRTREIPILAQGSSLLLASGEPVQVRDGAVELPAETAAFITRQVQPYRWFGDTPF